MSLSVNVTPKAKGPTRRLLPVTSRSRSNQNTCAGGAAAPLPSASLFQVMSQPLQFIHLIYEPCAQKHTEVDGQVAKLESSLLRGREQRVREQQQPHTGGQGLLWLGWYSAMRVCIYGSRACIFSL